MTTEELSDREAIRELYARYCFYVDLGRPDLFAADFAEDATLWLSDRGSYLGRDAILAHVGKRSGVPAAPDPQRRDRPDRRRPRDVARVLPARRARATATCVAYGMYDDLLARDGDRWRWQIKKVNYHVPLARLPAGQRVLAPPGLRRGTPPDVPPVCAP